MIIIEGFDCSGKSSLAARISERKGWPVVHTGGPTKDVFEVAACLARTRDRMKQQVIQDRCTHVSEAAYSMLRYPRQAALALNHFSDIAYPICFVYCRPPTDFLIEEYRRRHVAKEYDTTEFSAFVLENARSIIAIYDTLIHMIRMKHCAVINYDRTRKDDDVFIDIISEWHNS